MAIRLIVANLLILILASWLAAGASRCPDPRLRQASIGGETISGGVLLHKKPVRFVAVRLYSSSGVIAWAGKTDKNGRFTTDKPRPGTYQLGIEGWGKTTVQLDPKIDKEFGQTPVWDLMLFDNSCVDTTMIMN